MGKSGNPAKQAQRELRKTTIRETREAVEAGKTLVVRPYPETTVTIQSTEPDQAVEIVKAIQPWPQEMDTEMLNSQLYYLEFVLGAAGDYPEHIDSIAEFVYRMLQDRQLREAYEKKEAEMNRPVEL